MDSLLQTIAVIGTALHQERVDEIASAFDRLESPASFNQCVAAFGSGVNRNLAETMRQAWLASPLITGKEIALALRAASRTAQSIGDAASIDLVWTGPKTGLIPTRNTEQVIREVIDEAVESLFIVSYVFYNAASIVAGLNDASARGVAVQILLESSAGHGGVVSIDGLSAMHKAVPCAELYVWSPEEKAKSAGTLAAAVHAKCAVADHRLAFVTSANLTSAAMERNMELGILLRGGVTPTRLHSHLNALATTGTIVAWK
jgi:phosphatidylserine/phosphatidylglycerophosphate/cardiolipin synthase-like enzyme